MLVHKPLTEFGINEITNSHCLAHGDHLGDCDIEPCDGFYTGGAGDNGRILSTSNTPVLIDDEWTVYPNPAFNNASIDLSMLYGHEIQVAIYDVSGKAFWNRPLKVLETPVLDINTNSIPAGIYHIVMKTDTQTMVKKLVITK